MPDLVNWFYRPVATLQQSRDEHAPESPTDLPVVRNRRDSRDLVRRPPDDAPAYCAHCHRETRTVGHGACAECWQPKVEGGVSAWGEGRSRTESLTDFIDSIPDWVWIAVTIALVAGILRGIAFAL